MKALSAEIGLEISKDMLKKFLKKLGYSYRRIRKRVKGKPEIEDYNKKLDELTDLIRLEKTNFIKMYYVDEAGFNQTPSVPYGWQDKKEPMSYPTSRGQKWNVFGIMSSDNELYVHKTPNSITSNFVIEAIDKFAENDHRAPQAVLIVDNAKIHTSEAFKIKLPEWQEKGVRIFYLPTYSPHLNRIETLWRKIRYEWLLPHDFENWKTLSCKLELIFSDFGNNYKIKFTDF